MTRFRTLRLSLCLLLAVATVVLGGLSVRRKVASFQPLGFSAERAGGLVKVVRVDSLTTGLAAGDEILLIDGGEAGGTAALAQRLRGEAAAELAVLRGGQVVRIAYHRPPLAPDYSYLILVVIGGAYLLIGLYTLIRQQSPESFLFCLWCLASALLYLLTPVPPLDGEYRLVYFGDQLARCLLPALTLHLFLVFPSAAADRATRSASPQNPTAAAPRSRLLAAGSALASVVPFLYLPGAVLLTLQLDLMLWNGRWVFGRPSIGSLQALDRLDLLHLVTYSLAAVAVLLWRSFHAPAWEQRRQLQWMILGLAGGYLPFLVLYVVPFVLGYHGPELLTALSVLPLALVPLSFAWAILRYKLWDIEVIARDVVSATLTLLFGVVGFSMVNLAINRGVSAELPLARNLLSFGAGLGIAGLLMPARQSLSAALERLQYRGTFGKRRALLGLGRDLLHERDLSRLCGALLDRMAAGMDLDRLGLYLAQGDRLIAIHAVDAMNARYTAAANDPTASAALTAQRRTVTAPPPVFASDALDPAIWRQNVHRLSGTELPTGTPSPLQQLFIGGYRYAFPLAVRGRAIGLALIGFKHDQTPLNSEDIDLVRHLLNQAALAIENAQLLGQLHLQLQEVQRLQSYSDGIFESSPAGIAVLDGEQRLVSINPAFVALVGGERASLLGLRLAEVLPAGPLPAAGGGPIEVSYTDPFPQLAAPAVPAPAADLARIPAAAPGERCLQMSLAELAPGCTPQREPLHILVVYDVSERVAMERALKEKDRLAALGMLAAGVAHEVNTPITGISSYAQMLLSDTEENDPRYTLLKKVERQTFRAARIVNNLLEFARERNRERQPVALLPLLRECVELLGEKLGSGRIELAWETPPEVEELQVLGSDGELQQVFTNLLANALDAMAAQPRGRLVIGVAGAAGRQIAVRISDTGPGIPPELVETVFQPFYSTKLHRGGTGLGLTISYDIVQRHGGRLKVESAPGSGTCFTVELPGMTSPESTAGSAGAASL